MTTTIEVDRSGAWESIEYGSFKITTGTSVVQVAPTAEVETDASVDTQAGQGVRITIDGDVAFDGTTQSAGTIRRDGGKRVPAEHAGVALMDETVDVDLGATAPTDEEVLEAALAVADSGSDFTLSFAPSPTTLNDLYAVEGRSVKRVFRDMMDRTGNVWRFDPGGSTLHVEAGGGRGLWQALDAQSDRIGVVSYGEGSVETVRNDVTVVGTGDVAVEGSASDSPSISDYGRRTGDSPYQVSYISDPDEAEDLAQALIQADPLPSAQILAGKHVGDVASSLANHTIDLTDVTKGIDAAGLVITEQVIEQGKATLKVGGGAGDSLTKFNRRVKSDGDLTEPGSVMPTDRIDDLAITTPKLVDTAVIEDKLDDLAVTTAKLRDNAVVNGKLDDLSVSETKVQDDSISTPKLVAEAVTANEIEADTITAAEIAAGTITALEVATDTLTANEIAAGTITTLEIESDTLTANEIDTLDLDTDELTVGANTDSSLEFSTFQPTPDFDAVVLRPEGSGEALLGEINNEFFNVFSEFATFDEVSPLGGDAVGQVGTSSEAFQEMHAHNFVTASPDPIDAVDCGGLCDIDWYDNPPEVVRQRARDLGDDDAEVPDGRDHTPVDLGTMANFLLEATKAQQERIDALEGRIDALEQAVGGNA